MRYTPAATLQYPYLKLHQFVYLHSGGLICSRIIAGQALLLTTKGRRSGEPHTCALIYLRDGGRWVVVASNGGSDRPPSWLLNLQAHPGVGVQIGLNKFSARASVASAEDRERLWPRVNRHNTLLIRRLGHLCPLPAHSRADLPKCCSLVRVD